MSRNHSDVKDVIVIGGHLKRDEIESLDKVWQKGLTSEVREWGLNMTLNYLQQLNIPVLKGDLQYVDGYSCVYSLTASEVPFVTNILDEENQADPNFIVLGGMSGVGAKGTMAYGLVGANLLLQQEENSEMYQKTKTALGVKRLQNRIGDRTSQFNKYSDFHTSWFIGEQQMKTQ